MVMGSELPGSILSWRRDGREGVPQKGGGAYLSRH